MHPRQRPQRLAQRPQLARRRRPQARPRGQTNDVPHLPHAILQIGPQLRLPDQRRDRLVPLADRRDRSQRRPQPVAQHPRPHRRARAIDRPQQAPLALPVAQRFKHLEVSQRGLVEDHPVLELVPTQAMDQQRVPRLRLLRVGQAQRRRPGLRRLQRLAPALGPQVQHPRRHLRRDRPRVADLEPRTRRPQRLAQPPVQRRIRQDLARRQPRQRRPQPRPVGAAQGHELAAAHVQRRQPVRRLARTLGHDRRQIIRLLAAQVLLVDQHPRRHHPHHLAAHDLRPLAQPGLLRRLHLLADRHLEAALDQRAQIPADRVIRHPRHRHPVADLHALVARGHRDVEHRPHRDRVLEEHLVEVPHAKHQDRVGIPGLDVEELTHDRRIGRGVRSVHGARL